MTHLVSCNKANGGSQRNLIKTNCPFSQGLRVINREQEMSHQCKRTFSSFSCSANIRKRKASFGHSFKNRQYFSNIIHKQNGSTKSKDLKKIMKNMWNWCQERKISLTAEHLTGKENLIADWHSRNINDSSDWSLDQNIFNKFKTKQVP